MKKNEDSTISIYVTDRSKHNYVGHDLEILGKTQLTIDSHYVSCHVKSNPVLWHFYIVDGFLVIGYFIACGFIAKRIIHMHLN